MTELRLSSKFPAVTALGSAIPLVHPLKKDEKEITKTLMKHLRKFYALSQAG